MPDRPYVIDQMISAKSIAARVEALAKEITARFHNAMAADAAEQDFNNRAQGGVPDVIDEVSLSGAPLGIAQLQVGAGYSLFELGDIVRTLVQSSMFIE